MFIDSHCHLHFLQDFQDNLDAIIADAQKADILRLLCVATHYDQYAILQDIKSKYDQFIDISIGVHPTESVELDFQDKLYALAAQANIIAIGETGLDYYHQEISPHAQQEKFHLQLQIAEQVKKPIILHTRDAGQDTLQIISQYKNVCGVVHCFTETLDFAKKALDLGWYISFSGIITFKNAAELRAVAKFIPLDRLLIETDSPFLAPQAVRGQVNYPKYVKFVAEAIAMLHNSQLDVIAKNTTDNYIKLFQPAIA